MNQPSIAQTLRASVKLVKPELLAQVPDDYNPRQTFNYLRHRATNYDVLLDEHRKKYGDVTPAENKALTQGAADVIIGAFRTDWTIDWVEIEPSNLNRAEAFAYHYFKPELNQKDPSELLGLDL